MPRAMRVCSAAGCPELTATGGRCEQHKRAADQARGTAAERGYNSRHWRIQRRACLRRDPLCTCHDQGHGHGWECMAPSNVADHYPRSRRELVAMGVPDPDALEHLRGLCKSCHDKHTSHAQPGGWHASSL